MNDGFRTFNRFKGWDHAPAKGTYGSLSWRNQRSFWSGLGGVGFALLIAAVFALAIWGSIATDQQNREWFEDQLQARGLTVYSVNTPWTSGPFVWRKRKHDRVYYAETSGGTYWVMFSSWQHPVIERE